MFKNILSNFTFLIVFFLPGKENWWTFFRKAFCFLLISKIGFLFITFFRIMYRLIPKNLNLVGYNTLYQHNAEYFRAIEFRNMKMKKIQDQ